MSTAGPGRGLRYVAAVAAVFTAVVFTYIGDLLFGAPAFGAAVGLLAGAGIYLVLPGVVAMDTDVADETAIAGRLGPHRTAAGCALAAAGVAALGVAFAVEGRLLALLVGLAVGAAGYLPLAWLLPGR